MAANGDVYLSKYSGWYSVRDEGYFVDSELTDGPNGTKLAPSGAPVEWVEEESYFFKLSAYADRLLAHYEAHPEFITPETYRNEIVAFVKRGLSDLSISRATLKWGVPVQGDPKHVMYVWVDALTNYITATGFPDDGPRAKFWPADAHVIGKDITRFHSIYWPAFLMSAGLPVPKQVVVHGFLFNRGEKMSKSVGNVVDPKAMVEAYGLDAVRYFFLREVPFGQDGSYSHEAIVARMNADLADDIGNLAQRSLTMIAKAGARTPDWRGATPVKEDLAMLARADALLGEARRHMQSFALHLYIGAVFEIVSEANRYFANAEPWKLAKSDPARMGLVLYVTIETLRIAAIPAAGDAREHGRPSRPPRRPAGGPHIRGAGRRRESWPAGSAASARAGQGASLRLRRSFLGMSNPRLRSDGARFPLPPGRGAGVRDPSCLASKPSSGRLRRPPSPEGRRSRRMTIIDSHCPCRFSRLRQRPRRGRRTRARRLASSA